MNRRLGLILGLIGLVLVVSATPAWAQRRVGMGRNRASMTAYGPIPGGMSLHQAAQVQRQMQMIQQQQALMQQMQRAQAAQKKAQGKSGDKAAEPRPLEVKAPPPARPMTLEERLRKEREQIAEARRKLGLDKPATTSSGSSETAKPSPEGSKPR